MALLLLTFISTLCFLSNSALAMRCEYEDLFGNTQYLNCPGPLDDSDEVFCCGSDSFKYCCSDPEDWVEDHIGALVGIVVGAFVLFVLFCIVCCCCCPFCLLAKRRSRRGQVLQQGQGHLVTVTHQQPAPSNPSGYSYTAGPPPSAGPSSYSHQTQNFQMAPTAQPYPQQPQMYQPPPYQPSMQTEGYQKQAPYNPNMQ